MGKYGVSFSLWLLCLLMGVAVGATITGETGKWFDSVNCSGKGTEFWDAVVPNEAQSYYVDENPDQCIEILVVTAAKIDWNGSVVEDYWYWCTGVYGNGSFGGCVCPISLDYVDWGEECAEFNVEWVSPGSSDDPDGESDDDEKPKSRWEVGKCIRPLALPVPDWVAEVLPSHHNVYVLQDISGDIQSDHLGFFAVDFMDAVLAIMFDTDIGMGKGYVDGIVRPDSDNAGCVHGTEVDPLTYHRIKLRMHSEMYDWVDYHLVNQNCQHWAAKVLEETE